ncbi:MAG: GNAT family N-acetyltransferase [Turicibacter sp.]
MDYQIILAQPAHTEDIMDLLRKVTLDLHQKEIKQWIYPWDVEEISQDIKGENIYLITYKGTIIGTFSMNETANSRFESSTLPTDLYLYRIAITPAYQRLNLGLTLMNHICQAAKELGENIYLDCFASNEKLKSFYTTAGFEFIQDLAEEDYMMSVFKYEV